MPKAKSKAFARIRAEVIRLVGLIPPGKFTTYGSIAIHMNVMARHVAFVMSSLKEDAARLPWHRVVSADARLEIVGEAEGRMSGLGVTYSGNYTRLPWEWRLVFGMVDGAPVIVHWKRVDGEWRTHSAIERVAWPTASHLPLPRPGHGGRLP